MAFSARGLRASPGMLQQHVLDLPPTLRIGFSAARGFWKIIEISRPRRSRICVLGRRLQGRCRRTRSSLRRSRPARSRMRITA
jgi:hypothetical protein